MSDKRELPPPSPMMFRPGTLLGRVVRTDIAPLGDLPVNTMMCGTGDGYSWTFTTPAGTPLLYAANVRDLWVSPTVIVERERPTWATVLGVVGLFFFLVGIVFFFIKSDVSRPGALVTVVCADGRRVVVQCPREPYLLAAQLGSRVAL